MPAAIVIGAQWGDEGKGKIADHLAERAAYGGALSGRQQRRPHRHHRRYGAQAAPGALGHHPATRGRRLGPRHGHQPSCAGAKSWTCCAANGIDHRTTCTSAPMPTWSCPIISSSTSWKRSCAATLRWAPPARYRPGLHATSTRARHAHAGPDRPRRALPAASAEALERVNLELTRVYDHAPLDAEEHRGRVPAGRRAFGALCQDTEPADPSGSGAGRERRCWRALRRPCWTSTLAPILMSPPRRPRRAAPARARASARVEVERGRGRGQSLHLARGRGALPHRVDWTRSATGSWSAAMSMAPPPGAAAAAAGSTWWPALCGARQRLYRPGPHPPGRADRAG